MSRSSEGQGHSDSCLWKGLELSNSECEVNLSTKKVIIEKQN